MLILEKVPSSTVLTSRKLSMLIQFTHIQALSTCHYRGQQTNPTNKPEPHSFSNVTFQCNLPRPAHTSEQKCI